MKCLTSVVNDDGDKDGLFYELSQLCLIEGRNKSTGPCSQWASLSIPRTPLIGKLELFSCLDNIFSCTALSILRTFLDAIRIENREMLREDIQAARAGRDEPV